MLIVGLSGPSSSGKSTLAYELRAVLPNCVILHEDDFYVPEAQMPRDANGVLNWDCPEAFDLEKMRRALDHLRMTGKLPDNFRSVEEDTWNKPFPDQARIDKLKVECASVKQLVVLVEGILLYQEGSPLQDEMDIKLLITESFQELKTRREARKGYATAAGYWVDPPNYFEEVVEPTPGCNMSRS